MGGDRRRTSRLAAAAAAAGILDIINQTFLEMVTCFSMILTMLTKIFEKRYTSFVMCILFNAAGLTKFAVDASATSTIFVTVERYWKIVHPNQVSFT